MLLGPKLLRSEWRVPLSLSLRWLPCDPCHCCAAAAATATAIGREVEWKKKDAGFPLFSGPLEAPFPSLGPDTEHFSWSSSLCALQGFRLPLSPGQVIPKGKKGKFSGTWNSSPLPQSACYYLHWGVLSMKVPCFLSRILWESLFRERQVGVYLLHLA